MTIQYLPAGASASEIASDVETAVRDGRLRPGDALPPVRTLATELGLSPATVASAYRDLRIKGIARGHRRAGTHITGSPPTAPRPPIAVPAGARNLLSGTPDPRLLPPLPDLRRTSAPATAKTTAANDPATAITATAAMTPAAKMTAANHRAAAVPTPSPRLYGDPPVSPRLAAIASSRLAADGIDPSNLAVVGGALDGVERILNAWLRPGDRVGVEDPGYPPLFDLLTALDLDALPMNVDDQGVRPDALRRAIDAGAKAVVFVPRAQSPTGAAWDSTRAAELADVLDQANDILVIEDDHAAEVSGAPALTIASGRARWACIRSVSKSLGPDLRLAVMAGDAVTIARVEGRQALGTGWVSYLLQDTVAELWADPAVGALLGRAAEAYASRREGLISALEAPGIPATGKSGLAIWVPVTDEIATTSALLDRGWAVAPGERFRIASAPGIRIGVATLSELEIARLAADVASSLRSRPRRTD